MTAWIAVMEKFSLLDVSSSLVGKLREIFLTLLFSNMKASISFN